MDVRIPPGFCQYVDEACDQDFADLAERVAFFAYPGQPRPIAAAIEKAIGILKSNSDDVFGWKELPIAGQVIYCEICKAIRSAETVIADVSTLNFNLMFEVGFTIGLGKPLIPIRDSSYVKDQRAFDEVAVLDTLGYVDFSNSKGLTESLRARIPGAALPSIKTSSFDEQPLYVLKGRVETEGAIQLMSSIKKSGLRFRTYDPIESPRLSLAELRRQVAGSHGVVAHLLSTHRKGSHPQNALCALACGLAVSLEKPTLMIQEEDSQQPIDYRDIIRTYSHPDQIPDLIETLVREAVSRIQSKRPQPPLNEKDLERIDLGDGAAENEIGGLKSYFIKTGQFTQAKRGHARLVVGRKGTGKTAIFYGVRDAARRVRHSTVVDLKPEGHQFTRLRETVLSAMSPGLQDHTMTAFWNYLLLAEFARKIVADEEYQVFRFPERKTLFEKIRNLQSHDTLDDNYDFSQRLLHRIDSLSELLHGVAENELAGRVTEHLFSDSIREQSNAIAEWLSFNNDCWLLIDNIDKGWPTRGTTQEDITIVRSLLESVRKIERQFQRRNVEIKCLVFLRSDIYDHLVRETSDRGKDTPIVVEWSDIETFKELIRARVCDSLSKEMDFDIAWGSVFDTHVGAQDSFTYLTDRTLMRPRDLLHFLQRSVEVALNRNHPRVTESDIVQAEKSYSEDLLLTTAFEIEDTHQNLKNLLYQFEGQPALIGPDSIRNILKSANIKTRQIEEAIDLLLWFAFLGVKTVTGEATFSYEVRHNVERLKALAQASGTKYVIHPGFQSALNCLKSV